MLKVDLILVHLNLLFFEPRFFMSGKLGWEGVWLGGREFGGGCGKGLRMKGLGV